MSRQSKSGQDVTFEAAGDLSALQFTALKYTTAITNGQDCSVTGAGAGERAHMILQNKPAAAGRGATCRVSGFSKMKVDGSGTPIVNGSPLKVGSSGVGVVAGSDKDHVIATAAAPSTAAGDIIEVQITPYDLAV